MVWPAVKRVLQPWAAKDVVPPTQSHDEGQQRTPVVAASRTLVNPPADRMVLWAQAEVQPLGQIPGAEFKKSQ